MKLKIDVAIIGASLAGSTLAYTLGNAGITVALIDKSSFPRRKSCGEGLSNFGISEFRRIGITHALSGLPQANYNRFVLWKGNAPHIISPQGESPLGIGIQRRELDAAILKEACRSSLVTPCLLQRVRRIESRSGLFLITLPDFEIQSQVLVLANGAQGFLGDRVGVQRVKAGTPRYGASTHFVGEFLSPDPAVHVVVRPGYEIYCTPVGNGQLNVSLLGKRELLRELRNDSLTDVIQRELQDKAGFIGEQAEEFSATGPIGHLAGGRADGKVMVVGDAREQLDPIGGMGMSHAIVSASLAGSSLVKHFHEGLPLPEAGREYEACRAAAVRRLRGFTRLTYFGLITLKDGFLSSLLLSGPLAGNIARSVHGPSVKRKNLTNGLVSSIGAFV